MIITKFLTSNSKLKFKSAVAVKSSANLNVDRIFASEEKQEDLLD